MNMGKAGRAVLDCDVQFWYHLKKTTPALGSPQQQPWPSLRSGLWYRTAEALQREVSASMYHLAFTAAGYGPWTGLRGRRGGKGAEKGMVHGAKQTMQQIVQRFLDKNNPLTKRQKETIACPLQSKFGKIGQIGGLY